MLSDLPGSIFQLHTQRGYATDKDTRNKIEDTRVTRLGSGRISFLEDLNFNFFKISAANSAL
jgi:hypothetical protein